MRVFVVGATGLVGSGVARALRAGGHVVTGLARSDAAAAGLLAADVEPVRGDLGDPAALSAAVAGADVVVLAAFPRDAYADLESAIALDLAATDLLVRACADLGARLAYTSGISVVGSPPGGVIDDATPVVPPDGMAWRREAEQQVLAAGGLVVRPVFVYGRGAGDILVSQVRNAVERGEALHPLPGDNPWPHVHVDDLGRAYALAIEKAPPGTAVNVSGGESTPRDVAAAIARLIGRPGAVRGLPPDEAAEAVPYAGWLGGDVHVRTSSLLTDLGWEPIGPGLLDDIEHGSYRGLVPGA